MVFNFIVILVNSSVGLDYSICGCVWDLEMIDFCFWFFVNYMRVI